MTLIGAYMRHRTPSFRLDTARVAFQAGQYRVALIVLLLPAGWSIEHEAGYRGRGWRAEYEQEKP